MKIMGLALLLLMAAPLFQQGQDPEEAACRTALAESRTALVESRMALTDANVRMTALRNELDNMQVQRNLGLRERDAANEALDVLKKHTRCEARLLGVPVACKVVFEGSAK